MESKNFGQFDYFAEISNSYYNYDCGLVSLRKLIFNHSCRMQNQPFGDVLQNRCT